MTNPVTMECNNCANCYHQVIEHLKAASETCTECFAKDTKTNRYPNWKEVKRG